MSVITVRDAGTLTPSLLISTIQPWMLLLGKPRGLRWSVLVPGLALTLAGLMLMAAAILVANTEGGLYFWRGIGFALLALMSWIAFAFAIVNSAWLKRHPEVSATDWANWLGVATGLGALVCGGPLFSKHRCWQCATTRCALRC